MTDTYSDERRLVQETTDGKVRLEVAREILAAAVARAEAAEEDNVSLRRTIENLQAREAPLDRFKAAVQQAHAGARHQGAWYLCPHPVCRGLEEYLTAEAKDRRT